MTIKKPRKFTSDTFYKSRVGKFILARIDYHESVLDLAGYDPAVESHAAYMRRVGSYKQELVIPQGCDKLHGLEFVFEILSWRERRAMTGGFVPKYSMRAMWRGADIYKALQVCGERNKPTVWLHKEHCFVIAELSHEQAFVKDAEIARKYKAVFWPRRQLELG